MKTRIISAVVMLAILVPMIILGGIPFALTIGILATLAYIEISKLDNYPLLVKALGFISLISICYSNFDANMLSFGLDYKVISVSILLTLTPCIFYQTSNKYTSKDALKLLGFIILVGMGFNYLILIRNLGVKYFILLLLFSTLTDTFAYFGGTFIGKHKLIKISPKKTWEGLIVGVLVCSILSSIYYFTFINVNHDYIVVPFIFILMSLFGQAGDLLFSAIKRCYDIKDYSNIIPGHGGIIDRLDNIFYTAITLIIFIEYL